MTGIEICSAAETSAADIATIKAGTPGKTLMENAGCGVANAIMARYKPCSTLVLCGPGNNGGDGFVIARYLHDAGWQVAVALMGVPHALKGDAKLMFDRYAGEVYPLSLALLDEAELVVDALFGVGLTRPLDGMAREAMEKINTKNLPCVAVDIPSGVQSDSGLVMGAAPRCTLTVTFFRKKPGHLLYPGRRFCGDVEVVDIGIADKEAASARCYENSQDLWLHRFPFPQAESHKYSRGHAVVAGGGMEKAGAAKMAARAALRIGAGLVTIACPGPAIAAYASSLLSVMVSSMDTPGGFKAFCEDARKNAVLIGPGTGADDSTRAKVIVALNLEKRVVLDADALSLFSPDPLALFKLIKGPCILTPHEGEFARLFPQLKGTKLERAREAAKKSNAVVVLKGPDTVIAHPDGRAVINANAPAWLATAGSGDVLAGVCVGLLAQGMDVFLAACAAVWIHGKVAEIAGIGMIAEDLPDLLPYVIRELYTKVKHHDGSSA